MFKLLPTIFLLFVLIIAESCQYVDKVKFMKKTPREFQSTTSVDKSLYYDDKKSILTQLKIFLVNHEKSFYKKEYFDSTILIIDSILYNPQQNKVAIFVLTKNPGKRKEYSTTNHEWFYDGYCYLGKRQADTFDLKWLNRMYPINYYDQKEISTALRFSYFVEFAALKSEDGSYTYAGNLDDKRFWDCAIWAELYK